MRKILTWAAAAAVLIVPASASGRQSGQDQGSQQVQTAQTQPSTSAPAGQSQGSTGASGTQTDSLAAAARKAKAQLKEAPKASKVITNDDLPAEGGISTVGSASTSESSSNAKSNTKSNAKQENAKDASGDDEKAWRERFASLHHKLAQDQDELAIMQRELGVLDVQNYNDPTKALQQGYSRSDINQKTADIDAKKKDIQADQQAIDDAEEELRKSGGNSGWAQ